MFLALQQQRRRGLFRHIEITLGAGHAMLTLLEEAIGAITVAQIAKLPRFGCSAFVSHHVLIDENFDGLRASSLHRRRTWRPSAA